jgi:hypothetical protein
MKILKLKNIYFIKFKCISDAYAIYEFEDEHLNLSFAYGWPDDKGSCDFHQPFFEGIRNGYLRGSTLLEATADLIENLIRHYAFAWGRHVNFPEHPSTLIEELGRENLPLLMDFFQSDLAKEAFEKALKGE